MEICTISQRPLKIDFIASLLSMQISWLYWAGKMIVIVESVTIDWAFDTKGSISGTRWLRSSIHHSFQVVRLQ